jgi:hypothetical protein
VLDALGAGIQMLSAAHDFQVHRYDDLRKGVSERELQSRPNPYASQREALLSGLQEHLRERSFVVFHCTRLTPDEVEDVEANGLRLLTSDLVEQKVGKRVAAGNLTQVQGKAILEFAGRIRNSGGCTVDKLWGVLGRAALWDEHGLGPALAHWGGEALRPLELDKASLRFGYACIIEFSAPVSSMVIADVPAAMAMEYLFKEGATEEGGDIDVCIGQPIPSGNLRRIVRHPDPLFEELTGCQSWTRFAP